MHRALFFDHDGCVGDGGPLNLPHTFPPANVFASTMSQLGVAQTDLVMIYDTHGGLFRHAFI